MGFATLKQEEFRKGRPEDSTVLSEKYSASAFRYGCKWTVFFCDGVHLIYGYSGGHCWCEERICVPSAYGRKRLNCLGFMNTLTYQTETVMNDSYLNADIVCIREKNQDIWLYVILDNAAYQRCGKFRQCAEALNIHLIFLPSYSPNLNLIERLWRFLRKKVSADRFYSSFQEFFDIVKEFLSTVHIRFHFQLVSLLAYHFELFNYRVCISA